MATNQEVRALAKRLLEGAVGIESLNEDEVEKLVHNCVYASKLFYEETSRLLGPTAEDCYLDEEEE